jgi:cysteinyl-tRNA synthetase
VPIKAVSNHSGKLSHQNAEELLKHRVEPDPIKRNPGDFSLWKMRQDGEEATWDSPWGKRGGAWSGYARLPELRKYSLNALKLLKAVFDLIRKANRCINQRKISREELQDINEQLREYGEILGISFIEADKKNARNADNSSEELIDLLIELRQKLREMKEWQLADDISSEIGRA